MLERVQICEDVAQRLLSATLASRPWECCALLAGSIQSGTLTIGGATMVPNRGPIPDRFAIHNRDLRDARSRADAPILALYHSHQRRLFLSRDDVRSFSSGDLTWLIGVLQADARGEWALRLRAFTGRGGRILALDPELVRS